MVEKPLHTIGCSSDMGIYYQVTIVFFFKFKASTFFLCYFRLYLTAIMTRQQIEELVIH